MVNKYAGYFLACLLLIVLLPGIAMARTAAGTGIQKAVTQARKQIPSLGAFVVWRSDSIIHEQYFNGTDSTTAFNVKSVTKSILSTIAGAAVQQGYALPVDTPVLAWLPEYRRDRDSMLQRLSLRSLLTMQAGIQWKENSDLTDEWSNADDPVGFYLALPFVNEPMTEFRYSTGAAHTFGAVLSRIVHTDLRHFADTALFLPAQVRIDRWDTDARGLYHGGSELYLTARNLMRLGILYLHGGRVGHQQLIAPSWIRDAWAPQVALDHWDVLPGANGYGYYWWRRLSQGHQVYVASGYGGQLLCIIPDLDMVVVTTCVLNRRNRGRSEIKRLHLVIDKIITEVASSGT